MTSGITDPLEENLPPEEEPQRGASGGLRSVGAAIDVLMCFRYEPELGVTQIARRLGIAKSTAYRLVSTLRGRGMLERNPDTGLYRLGLRLGELGMLARDRHPVRHAILPYLVELRRNSGMPVLVGAPDRGDIVTVDHLSSSAAPARAERIPWRLPLHRTAGGLAICAFDEASARLAYLAVESDTRGPFYDAEELEEALEEVRGNGWALLADPYLPGVSVLAVPILDSEGHAHFAVAILVPRAEQHRAAARFSAMVLDAAKQISRSVAATGPDPWRALLPRLLER